jgi:hypothetical protein
LPKRAEKIRMSSILPRGLRKKIDLFLERTLPLKWRDLLNQYWVQTRLIFSRTILLVLAAMFFFFTWGTIEQQTFKERDAFLMLILQTNALAILLHMNLWETEREDRTFELLLMRIPNLHRLTWFKMRVSLFWMFVLSMPFFIGYTWFINIPIFRAFLYLFFCMTSALLSAFVTCTVTSFVHNSLATGIISVILIWIIGALMDEGNLPKKDYYNFFINPFNENDGIYEKYWILIINRILLFLFILVFFGWFNDRLKKTEKWIL